MNGRHPMLRLGDYVRVRTGKLDANASDSSGQYPFFTCSQEPLRISSFSYDCECVLVAGNGDLNVKYYDGKFDAYQRTYIIEPVDKEQLDVRYLFHLMSVYVDQLRNMSIGGVIKYIKLGYLTEAKFAIPPLSEQRRIAEILDRTEALRAKRRTALAQLDALTQSIFLDLFGDPFANPSKWKKANLGDFASFVGGGTPSRACPEYFAGSICWATSKDMKYEFLDDTEEHITQQAVNDSATKIVPAGTILVVVKSKVLAHRLPVAVARVETCFGQDLKGIVLKNGFETSFVATSLRLGSRWLLERARGINTEGLTLDHLRAFPMIEPPSRLQGEFAQRVGQVERLKASSRASLAELDSFFSSLQSRAFRGEL